MRKVAIPAVILAKVRGTLRTKLVCVNANTRIAPFSHAHPNGIEPADDCRFGHARRCMVWQEASPAG